LIQELLNKTEATVRDLFEEKTKLLQELQNLKDANTK